MQTPVGDTLCSNVKIMFKYDYGLAIDFGFKPQLLSTEQTVTPEVLSTVVNGM